MASRARSPLLACLVTVLLPAGSAVRAETIASIGPVRLVPFAGAPVGAGVIGEDRLRHLLTEEVGKECEPGRIEESLAARYRALGYIPTVRATCTGGRLDVVIRESSHRIALITFDPSELKAFGLVASAVEDEKPLYPVPEKAPREVLRGVMQSRPGDLYNVERYRADRNALGRLGYALLFIPRPPASPDDYPEGALLIQSLAPLPEEGGSPARRRNYLGGTAGYGPRSGASAGVVYQRRDLVRPYDRLTLSPTFNTAWGGTLQYTAPLVAESETPRRLYDLGGSLYSTFQNNRFLDGEERDERRNGVSITLGARPLGLAPQHSLRVDATLRYEEVSVEDLDGGSPAGQTILRFGADHEWRHTWVRPGFSLHTSPSLEWAIGAGSEPEWLRPELEMTFHARLPAGFETDLRFSAGGLDRPVPEFELFSLGGVLSVRGFREDTFLGRSRALAQAELWIPFSRPLEARPVDPGEAGDPSAVPFEPRFARRLKAAVFVDSGAAWQTTAGDRQTLTGAGVGVRFVVPDQPLVIRLDYGWGFGSEGGESFPYVSLGYHF